MADQVTQSPEDDALLGRVRKALEVAEPYHRRWRKRATHYWSLWNNVQDFKHAYRSSGTERGRDATYRDGQKTFGAEMFIPLAFSTVETMLPKILSNRPTMKAKARDPVSEPNVQNVEALVADEQEKIGYELKLQEIAKDGLICGLGVEKIGWREEYRRTRRWAPSEQTASANPSGLTVVETLEKVWDDPDVFAVDPFDWIWDPYGFDVASCEYVFHRTWRSNAYVKKMVELYAATSGRKGWRNIDEKVIERLDSTQKYDEVWQGRLKASQMGDVQRSGDRRLHEVLEFHDGEQVITVLDRQAVVASGQNPFWHGEKPFHVYRPTFVPHMLQGRGEVEPIEDLQEEMNTLRRQRRDNASFVLQKVVAYADGMLDQADIQFFPGAAIPVQGGVDPREVMFPIPVGDIPYSGYQEEDRLRADVDRTTGLSDPVMGVAQQGGQTATAAQLVYQAATERIKNKTTRLELEIINPGTEQMVELCQQKILEPRDVRVPADQPPVLVQTQEGFAFQGADPERRFEWRKLGPMELAGNFAWQADGSTTPENVPQMRSDAEGLQTLSADNPNIDARKITVKQLELLGIKNPDSFLAAPEAKVPPETLDILAQQYGVPQATIAAALNEALTGKTPPNPDGAAQNGAPTTQEAPSGSR